MGAFEVLHARVLGEGGSIRWGRRGEAFAMPEAETGGHSLISRDNQHLITGEQQQHQHQYQHQQQHQQDPAQITSDSPLWRLFLDSSCSSASVFLRQKKNIKGNLILEPATRKYLLSVLKSSYQVFLINFLIFARIFCHLSVDTLSKLDNCKICLTWENWMSLLMCHHHIDHNQK